MTDDDPTILRRFPLGDPDDPHGDRATLFALEDSGSDLTKPTQFIHHLRFADGDLARTAGRAIVDELGYRVSIGRPAEEGHDWLIHASTERVPAIENVHRMRRVMEVAAEKFHGEYDGWEAAIRR